MLVAEIDYFYFYVEVTIAGLRLRLLCQGLCFSLPEGWHTSFGSAFVLTLLRDIYAHRQQQIEVIGAPHSIEATCACIAEGHARLMASKGTI